MFKIKHQGEAPEQISIGVRVSDDSPRETLEVPVLYEHDGRSEIRCYTFTKFTRQRADRTVLQERRVRFLQCPREVAELMAGLEFQERDPMSPGGVKRGQWLDVRLASTQDQFDKAESLVVRGATKAETEPEPVNLLRQRKVSYSGPATMGAGREAPGDADLSTGAGQPNYEVMTVAQLKKHAEGAGLQIPPKANKAKLIELLNAHAAKAATEG
jgi:hypothetical protein